MFGNTRHAERKHKACVHRRLGSPPLGARSTPSRRTRLAWSGRAPARARRSHRPERTGTRAGAAPRCHRWGWTRTAGLGMVGPRGATRGWGEGGRSPRGLFPPSLPSPAPGGRGHISQRGQGKIDNRIALRCAPCHRHHATALYMWRDRSRVRDPQRWTPACGHVMHAVA